MADTIDPDLDGLAADLTLGLLTGDERARALRLSLSNPAFAQAVDAWRGRLDPMYAEFDERPAPNVWPKIEARLGSGVASGSERLRRWRWTAIGSSAVAAGFATAFFMAKPEPITIVREVSRAPSTITVAQLAGTQGALLAANYTPGFGDLRIRAVSLPTSDLVPELWIISAGGVPRSLGLLDGAGTTTVKVPASLRSLLVDGATLAVSLEVRDGAPHQSPSSTPIATGKITQI
ncbi:anti-sigma factor [Sphingomonas sp. Y38-1Y]|uniref:anti-sigma factor n=1 Tax=Sphingomonas sp. Y38-1Y TaxID=3078265 RepID=UPI0028E92C8B|nr:anti-sigma factor [Sphingomonas sp. Y38-1Y]